jgi:hypothetical protein
MQGACITIDQWLNAGLSFDSYKKERQRGKLKTLGRSCKGQKVKILLDSIEDHNKREAILKTIANPEKDNRKTSFIERIVIDEEAKEFFKSVKLADGKHLPEERQTKYVLNASIYNLLREVYKEEQIAKKRFGSSMRGFWQKATEVLQDINNEIPHTIKCKNPRVVQRNFDLYLSDSYPSLIKERWGNQNSSKITPEIEEWYINEMCQSRLSAAITYFKYMEVAKKKGWPMDITAAAFEARMAKEVNRTKIQLKRWGAKTHRNKKGQTFSLRKATNSNDLWVSDGTSFNWYYNQDGKPAMATTYFVMDSLSRKMLGWSTLAGINKENMAMQLEAYRKALRVSGAKPYQLKYDNQGGHKAGTAREFYSKLATVHFPTRAYRPSGKRVEPTFKDFQTVKLAEMPFWTGYNRKSHANPDMAPDMEGIMKYIHLLPTYQELLQLIDITIEEWNAFNYNGKGSPNEIYAQNRRADEEPIALDDLAEMFWDIKGPLKYHPVGIMHNLNGDEKLYEVYTDNGDVDYNFRKNFLNQKFYVKYDPEGEYPEIDLLQKHPTAGYQKVATASPKKTVSESVRGLRDGEKEWISRQMELESSYYEELSQEVEEIGYNEEEKFSKWREKLQPVLVHAKNNNSPSLYLDDNDTDLLEIL